MQRLACHLRLAVQPCITTALHKKKGLHRGCLASCSWNCRQAVGIAQHPDWRTCSQQGRQRQGIDFGQRSLHGAPFMLDPAGRNKLLSLAMKAIEMSRRADVHTLLQTTVVSRCVAKPNDRILTGPILASASCTHESCDIIIMKMDSVVYLLCAHKASRVPVWLVSTSPHAS